MTTQAPHVPVLIEPLVKAVSPVSGLWVDGTFGAGGYSKQLLAAGADRIIGIDRDPSVRALNADWMDDRVELVTDTFSNLDQVAETADGVVLDLGVSSMQIDQADRGFSFQKDGPLDMRMGQDGYSAADLVNEASEAELADILFVFGEERASRRIARAIVKARDTQPMTRTLELADVIKSVMPFQKPGQSHPATRSFQAIRVAVNAEYEELVAGLNAAERLLAPGGHLAVVTFHSVEDRIVKRFLQARGDARAGSRHAPAIEETKGTFETLTRKAVNPSDDEIDANPRSRSARLRVARRTVEPVADQSTDRLGVPRLRQKGAS